MTANWQEDKRWSDRFIPQIKRILGEHLLGEASEEDDTTRNTDLVVLIYKPVRVACRIRQKEYAESYGHQFTIRAGRPSGTPTELAKILEGWGDFMFYGFGDEQTATVTRWTLLHLGKFRVHWSRFQYRNAGRLPGIARENHDGSSVFRAIDIATVERDTPGFVVASSWHRIPEPPLFVQSETSAPW